MIRILFAAKAESWEKWHSPLTSAFAEAGLEADLSRDHPPDTVDWIVLAPNGPVTDFTPYTRTKGVLSLWAGVEDVVGNTTLTQPLARLVDPGLTQGMVEWVTGHVLRHHLGTDRHVLGQDGVWRDAVPPLASDRVVGMLGLGELGAASAGALASLGFGVHGWSRSAKAVNGVTCHHGDDGLQTVLSVAQILVLLLPLTNDTRDILDAGALVGLQRGAVIINPGRGPLIDDAALLAALDSGQVAHATLDVFRTEPLPEHHPFWRHPRVTVTPHIASATRPKTAARRIAANVARGEAGKPLLHLVDRTRGY